MTTMAEVAKMPKLFTDAILHCPICNKNSNFLYVVKKEESKYYLGTRCSNPNCNHFDDFTEIAARLAHDYPAPQK